MKNRRANHRSVVSPSEPRLRPGERVMRHMRTVMARVGATAGSRLPTTREVAAELGVSVFTVRTVFQRLAQEGRIRSEVGNGSFLVTSGAGAARPITIALNTSPPSGSLPDSWTYRIYGGILKASMDATETLLLRPLAQAVKDQDAIAKELLTLCSQTDGLILFPVTATDQIRAAYENAGKPVVDLNPPSETATANFVAPDYFNAALKLGQAWKETGRQRIVMLAPSLESSVSGRLRRVGLLAGLGTDLGSGISFRFVDARDVFEPDGFDTMRGLLSGNGPVPDAIFCSGDLIALGVLRALMQAGLRVPEDVSVVGGSGVDLSETVSPQLTRTRQPLEKMGEELVAMLRRRIQMANHGCPSLPGRYLPLPYMGGATTRAEENARLQITPRP